MVKNLDEKQHSSMSRHCFVSGRRLSISMVVSARTPFRLGRVSGFAFHSHSLTHTDTGNTSHTEDRMYDEYLHPEAFLSSMLLDVDCTTWVLFRCDCRLFRCRVQTKPYSCSSSRRVAHLSRGREHYKFISWRWSNAPHFENRRVWPSIATQLYSPPSCGRKVMLFAEIGGVTYGNIRRRSWNSRGKGGTEETNFKSPPQLYSQHSR